MNPDSDGWLPRCAIYSTAHTTSFDPSSELIWTGDLSGKVESLFAASNLSERYTAYRGHVNGPVKHLLVDEKGVFSIGGDSVKCANRRGLTVWNVYPNEGNVPPGRKFNPPVLVSALSFTNARASDLVVSTVTDGGMTSLEPDLLVINASTGTILRKVTWNLFCQTSARRD